LISSALDRALSGNIEADIASHERHLSDNSVVELHTDGAPSSPKAFPSNRFDDSANNKVTPRKPRKRLEEAFSGQTATPPQSASKGTRKLAPKIQTENMQNDSQNSHYGIAGTPIHETDFSPFPPTSMDMFGYPMSAPATASSFTNTKPFWDSDSNMGGMGLEFSTDDANMFAATGSHRINNSFDWGRSNQMFQDNMNMPQSQAQTQEEPVSMKQPVKRQRALAPKVTLPPELPKSIPPFEFNNNGAVSDDPFSIASMEGGVDPGLLFSRNNSISMTSGFEDVVLPAPRPATSHLAREPYQHQQRELRRDQEELRRSRSSRERSSGRSFDRQTVSSPVKGSARPGLHRSASDSRNKRSQGKSEVLFHCS
jgi:hypothetical protein